MRGKKHKWIFHNFGDLLQPFEFEPASRERVVPTGWQVRTVLGDCITKTKLISIRAPPYRQYALISDFLDLANLSLRDEATLATNWIKDLPDGLKTSEPSIGHYDRRGCAQFSKECDCRCPVRP